MDKYERLIARIKSKVDHGRKRQRTDVIFDGAKHFWQGYLIALATTLEEEEMIEYVEDILAKASEVEEWTDGRATQ